MKRTVHLPEGILDTKRRKRHVGVGSHNANDAARLRVEAGGDNTKNDVLRSEDTGDALSVVLHDANGGRTLLAHKPSGVAYARLNADRSGSGAGVENRTEVREGHLVAESLDVGEERVGVVGAAELLLGALEGGVELLGGAVGLLELLQRLVEDLGDVEETDDVAFLVADGLWNGVSVS